MVILSMAGRDVCAAGAVYRYGLPGRWPHIVQKVTRQAVDEAVMLSAVTTSRPVGRPRLATRSAFGLFVVVSAAHLICTVEPKSAAAATVATATQPALMPALALWLLARNPAPKGRTVGWVLAALGCSWLGDTLPRFLAGDGAFLALIGCFLLAQGCYVTAFAPFAGQSAIAVHRARLIGYVAFVAAVLAVCLPNAGILGVPVVIYGLSVGLMAVLATGLGWRAGLGGALFAVSDALIAIDTFADFHLSQQGLAVMVTYCAAQALIVWGVLTHPGITPRRTAAPAGGHVDR